MSRVGKNPINIPDGVQVTLAEGLFTAKGKKGELSCPIPALVSAKQEEGVITFEPKGETQEHRAMWGLARALANNVVQGVTEGFERKLEIKGVGYRAAVQGRTLNLSLGFSHPVNMEIPQGLDVTVTENTQISVAGADKQAVGQFAAKIRDKRPVEPYKGKGVRYVGEHVVMKEGKKK